MARPRTTSRDQILERAMNAFWREGYEGTSMSDLVEVTGATRQAIYGDFGSKHGLYADCFGLYRQSVVEPALEPFNSDRPGLAAIADYFEFQIARAERAGLPGPGCLVGNATTEIAPNDVEIAAWVKDHHNRLEIAFARSLPATLTWSRRTELARFLVLAAQGLWAISRITDCADELRSQAATILSLLERELADA